MEQAVQILAVIHFATMGLSHIVQPEAWARFFVRLRGWGEPGVFVVGFLSLAIGSLIVAFHNVWHGIPLVLTLYGWSQVIKALLYFTAPGVGLKSLERVSVEEARRFAVPGFMLLALAGLLAFHLFLR